MLDVVVGPVKRGRDVVGRTKIGLCTAQGCLVATVRPKRVVFRTLALALEARKVWWRWIEECSLWSERGRGDK